jgi:hypothetical protein
MPDNRNDPNWEEHKNQAPQQNTEGGKQQTNDALKPDNRLTDGTNDFANGDQEPTSESSSKEKNQS